MASYDFRFGTPRLGAPVPAGGSHLPPVLQQLIAAGAGRSDIPTAPTPRLGAAPPLGWGQRMTQGVQSNAGMLVRRHARRRSV